MTTTFVYDLAARFSDDLRDELSESQMSQVLERNNAEEHAGICHSHDFLDANEVMLAAWVSLRPADDVDVIIHNEANTAMWNEAWNIAQENGFDTEAIRAREKKDFRR